MKQLKVATFTRDNDRKTARILRTLEGYPEGLPPKQIALLSGVNVNTVKSILPKIKNVKKIMRGYYKVYSGGDTPPSGSSSLLDVWCFHNLVLSSDVLSSPPVSVFQTFNVEILNFEFSFSTTGRSSFRVSCDSPLSVSSICLASVLFKELLRKHCPDPAVVDAAVIMVSTVEFNHDYINLRLDGLKSLALDGLVEQFKLYQKRGGLRLEHKTKVPFQVETLIDMLSAAPGSLDVQAKLAAQKVELERLTAATIRNADLLKVLLSRLGGGL